MQALRKRLRVHRRTLPSAGHPSANAVLAVAVVVVIGAAGWLSGEIIYRSSRWHHGWSAAHEAAVGRAAAAVVLGLAVLGAVGRSLHQHRAGQPPAARPSRPPVGIRPEDREPGAGAAAPSEQTSARVIDLTSPQERAASGTIRDHRRR